MPENAPNWKSLRTELRSHLSRMHGGIGVGVSPALSLEQLEDLHNALHVDEYCCPPHSHDEPQDYLLGNIILKYGEDYARDLVALTRGELV